MYKFPVLVLVLVLVASTVTAAEFGARVGYYGNDVKKAFVGVEAVFPIGPFAISPSVDYTRVEGVNLYFAHGDLQYVGRGPSSWYWLGAGPTYGYATLGGVSAHEWGWNGNAGYGWNAGSLRPYVMVRYVKVKELKATGAAIGLRFGK